MGQQRAQLYISVKRRPFWASPSRFGVRPSGPVQPRSAKAMSSARIGMMLGFWVMGCLLRSKLAEASHPWTKIDLNKINVLQS